MTARLYTRLRLALAGAITFSRAVLRARPTWAFLIVWSIATSWLAIRGYTSVATLAIVAMPVVALWSGLTIRITESPKAGCAQRVHTTIMAATQLIVVLAVIMLTAHSALVARGVLAPLWHIVPVWTRLLDAAQALADALGVANHGYVLNPVRYFVVPAAVLFLLGARPRELGLCASHRWLSVTLLWSAFGVAAAGYGLIARTATAAGIGSALVRSALLNGFFEEFLFRGALLTRCRLLCGEHWALVISSLAFGAWHAGAAAAMAGTQNAAAALCIALAVHSLGGLAFGVIFMRTRSLLAPSITHVLLNLV